MTRAEEWDAIVIGAGPAGTLAARQLALGRRRVLLVDKKRFPRPKVCGACINARAISTIRAAGLDGLLATLGGQELNELEIIADGRRARIAMPPGLAIGRAEFDQALAHAAVDAGCEFRDGTLAKVGPLRGQSREVVIEDSGGRQTLSARVVLAADGLEHLSLSHDAVFESDVATNSLIGVGATVVRTGYYLKPGTVQMIAGPAGYVGIVAMDDERLNLAAAVSAGELRRFGGPALLFKEMLDQAQVASPDGLDSAQWHGTGALTRATRQVADARLLLLGDATGYVEPFTGEGIAWALSSALLVAPLAEACITGSASAEKLAQNWCRLHETQIKRRQWWCHQIAWVLRTAWRRRAAIAATSALPWLAGGIAAQINEPFTLSTA